jgi:hypothetical protein
MILYVPFLSVLISNICGCFYNDSYLECYHQINDHMIGAKAAYTSAGFDGYELDPTIGKVLLS